jgi:hypothetical protein
MSHFTSKFKSTPTPTFKSRTNSIYASIQTLPHRIKHTIHLLRAPIALIIMTLQTILTLHRYSPNSGDRHFFVVTAKQIPVQGAISHLKFSKSQVLTKKKFSTREGLVLKNLRMLLQVPASILSKFLRKTPLNLVSGKLKDF